MEPINKVISEFSQLNSESSKKTESNQETFMTLMLAQLKHQDPLKPMESGEFLTQISQFTVASGVKELKDSFANLSSAMTSGQALQASSMVGKEVLVSSDQINYGGSGPISFFAQLDQSSPKLNMTVVDEVGQTIRNLNLGARPQGRQALQWDGLTNNGQVAPSGNYSIRLSAEVDKEEQALEVLHYKRVASVSLGGDQLGMKLNLDGSGSVSLSQVKEIR